MPFLPLGRASYERAGLPRVTLKNLFYEAAPSNLEDQVSLIPRPRLSSFATLGAGPINGIYRKGGVMADAGNSGKIIAVSGGTLYKVDQTTGTATLLGTVAGSLSRMSAEGNTGVVVLTRGSTLYSTDGNSVSTIAMPSSFAAYAVDVLNDYFIIASDLGRFYWTAPGATTVDALDYATAESQPDILLTVKVLGDELWLGGRLSWEVWQPTGDLDLPFQRIGGRIFGIGITARDTAQKLNVGGIDKLCWVGTDRRVYMTDPNPVKISTPDIEEKLARSTVSLTDNTLNPYAVTYPHNGHDFYVLHIPGEGSFAFDLSTKLWDEVTSYGRAHFRGAVSGLGVNNQPLFGDDTSNVIWEMVTDQTTDGTDQVVFEFSGLLEVPGAPLRCANVSLDVETGTTIDPDADPMMQMAYSDDMGATFTDADDMPLGRMGERNTRVLWARLGRLVRPGRVFRFRTTEPVVVRKAKYNETLK